MKKNLFSLLGLSSFIAASILVGACASSEPKPEESSVPTAVNADENTLTGDSDSGKAMGLQTIHFAYDSQALDASSKDTLKANAEILKANMSVKIQIEGHCDQSGGIQYNIALGERRANSTKKFMVDQGIASDRITTISFGKERPADPGNSEEAHAKNRRANFVITSK